MTYGVRGVYEIQYNKTVPLAKTVEQQQQVFLQLLMVYTIVYLMCQPFLNIFRLKLFWDDLQNLFIEKASSLVPLISLIGFQQLLRAPLPHPFRGFGSSDVSA